MDFILQQIMSFWVDFFFNTREKMLKDGASFDEITQDTWEFIQFIGVFALQEMMKTMEEEMHEQIKDTHKYHVIDKNRKRTLTTRFGDVAITRRYYKEKESGKRIFLFDKILKIPANDRIETGCKAALVEKSADVSYSKAAETITEGRLHRQSVCNAVREAGVIPEKAAKMPRTNRKASRIYIEADEDHVAMQDGTTKQNKLILVYENKETVGKARKKLVAKRVFTGYQPAEDSWIAVNDYLKRAYEPGVRVTIIGDGAAWIKKGLEVISHSDFALDLFHLSKYAKKVTGNKAITGIYSALRANDEAWFKAKVRRELKEHPEREKAIREGARYIENQWEGARKSLSDKSISSSTEAHVSHILSDRLSSRGMGWGEENSEIIGSLRAYRENGGKLQEYIKGVYQKERSVEKATEGIQEAVEEGLKRTQERAAQRLRNVRLGVHMGHMPGSELARNAWMRGIIDGNMN